jgi:hypothetical protein
MQPLGLDLCRFRFRRESRVAFASDQEREALAFFVEKSRAGGLAALFTIGAFSKM